MKVRFILGWLVFLLSLAITSFWSFWGVFENFYEGWYHVSTWENLKLALIQYFSVPVGLLLVTVVSVNYQKVGAVLFWLLGIFAFWFFDSNSGRLFIFLPAILLGGGFYLGRFKYKKWMNRALIILPSLIILIPGIIQLIKVESRYDDGDYGMRVVEGNGVILVWTPQGPGFPLVGTDWITAKNNCARLNDSGTGLENEEINIWRLPTRDEIVKSATKGNVNAGGKMDPLGWMKYDFKPDKETPLWNPHSQVIYYWTSEPSDEQKAFMAAYSGEIMSRSKTSGPAYQGYRCVRDVM